MESSNSKSLDRELWHACAGSMILIPKPNTRIFYFPQGHAEHTSSSSTVVNFNGTVIPPLILCRVLSVNYLADPETDEVYAKIKLLPIPTSELDLEPDDVVSDNNNRNNNSNNNNNNNNNPCSFFAKTLTQSDANNGGGFSVPRYCAETIFPQLDYAADPPVQTVIAKDVLGNLWKFRHIYRGTPRRHLLTTGWSIFVNQKKLIAGDSIVFYRSESGEICVGIRRAKRGIGIGIGIGGPSVELNSGWNSNCVTYPFGGFSSMFMKEHEGRVAMNNSGCNGFGGGNNKVGAEDVVEAVSLAVRRQPFEIVYYPRARTPEFCVKAALVMAAMRIRWCDGMRFKMPFETEDSSRISWFMGTVSSARDSDPIRWPNSPWRLLEVTWDEPDLLQNVKRVSPWLVELVSNMPPIHVSSFPQNKKLRLSQNFDFPLNGQFPIPSFSGNPLGPHGGPPLCFLSNNTTTPAGIQGARHAQFGQSFSDLQFVNNKPQQFFLPRFDQQCRISNGVSTNSDDNLSCLLTMGNNSSQNSGKTETLKRKHQFILFGQPIVTEQQISSSCSSDTVSQVLTGKNTFDDKAGSGSPVEQRVSPEKSLNSGFPWHPGFPNVEPLTGHCKVFMESEDVGRTLDLTVLGSYEELYIRLASMFKIEISEILSRVLYRDGVGAVRRIGEEPFSDFTKSTKRLTIMTNSESGKVGWTWIRGMLNSENGCVDASHKTGPLSICS
ncbi:hypothetical protein ACFE04_005206 [Oxalis oulophora]